MSLSPTIQPAPRKKVSAAPGDADALVLVKMPVADASATGDDGTSQLLKWGGWTLGFGLFCALLTKTIFGGIGAQGPHTNSGWMALIVTMMCLPFGFLLFLLGALKWLRQRRHPNG